MLIVGLTGSIGMGKTETAKMFAKLGIPVFDADQTVHRLYDLGGKAVDPIARLFPNAVHGGKVDREILAGEVLGNAGAIGKLERIVHPLVREAETDFLRQSKESGAAFVVLDIPLLLETGNRDHIDKIIVVTTSAEIQRERVLGRDGMTIEKFEAIKSKQMPDAEKRAKADFIVDTSLSLEDAFNQVQAITQELKRIATIDR